MRKNLSSIDYSKHEFGLIPAVIQDNKTRQVLMMGYMNEASLKKTQLEGKVTFFSRSKNRLWTKGEVSGNFLIVKNILLDCDGDTLLIKVVPVGPVCHTGTDTCWDEPNTKPAKNFPFLKDLENILETRKHSESDQSYVKKLYARGTAKIAQKVGEEAAELIIEAMKTDDDLFLEEASDLFFHYLMLLHDRNYALKDVLNILEGRNKKSRKGKE